MAGGVEVRPTAPAELVTRIRQRTVLQGQIAIGSALIHEQPLGSALSFYLRNASAFQGDARAAFLTDVTDAQRYQNGVVSQTEGGEVISFLGDYVAERRGQIMEIDTALADRPNF